jgi:hypothetical protein
MNCGSLGGSVMTCRSPFKHMLKNIMVEIFDSPCLWKIRDDKESEFLTYVFCSKPESFPRPRRVVL